MYAEHLSISRPNFKKHFNNESCFDYDKEALIYIEKCLFKVRLQTDVPKHC